MSCIGPPTYHTVRNRVALKHPCALCGELIVRTQAYIRWCWKDGADLTAIEAHQSCSQEARQYDWYNEEWPCSYPLREEWNEQQSRTGREVNECSQGS